MRGKICLVLLMLCGIWSLGFIGTLANKNIKSLSYLVRQKRVISHVPGEDRSVRIDDHPYIANIKLLNRVFCVGTILSPRIIITAAECGHFDVNDYKVISGTSASNRIGITHNVREIKLHYGNHPGRAGDGIALFNVHPHIAYSRFSFKLDLHVEPLLPGKLGIVTGWGFNKERNAVRGTDFPWNLRTIQVPIMTHRDCVNMYRGCYPITEKDVCTFHSKRRSGHTDVGAPLVVDNKLVGIFLRRGPIEHALDTRYPDVFAFLQDTIYSNYIRANI